MRADVLELMAEEIGRGGSPVRWRDGFRDWSRDPDWRELTRLNKRAKNRRYRLKHRARILEWLRAYYVRNRDRWPKWSARKREQARARRWKGRPGITPRSGCSACKQLGHNRRTCGAAS